MAVIPEITLSSGEKTMPVIGMGTSPYAPTDKETTKIALIEAIKAGYRHFDTAFAYRSEEPLGEAISEALRLGLIKSRDELFITSKLWSSFADKDMVVPAIRMSLRNLQLEYLDLYLIHWPFKLSQNVRSLPTTRENIFPLDIKSVWEGMEECKTLGLTKAIGVSNFSCKKLEELLSTAKIPPAVNQASGKLFKRKKRKEMSVVIFSHNFFFKLQVEMNPLWQQKQLREFCKGKGIHITAYSPLGANGTKWGDNRILECDVLQQIAKAKGKTTAQVSLRWVHEQGVSLVAKSFNKERMKENLQIFDWSLTEEESNKISNLPQRKGVLSANILGPHDFSLELDAEI
ncbi:D-galacturonate reductase isoform X1 [Manihot esculenta]|uniref:D-galacturonate reductase isoform X1 n=1 Tax=Manihot esculenta TaxID=3983 RepID=UPI001CC4FBCD|nr:D-galacturonate reductase isoform X1 [Manihot esculenta]